MSKNAPIHEIKVGRVKAAIWAHETESGVRHSVKLSKLWKDKEGKWQDSEYFSREELPLLIKAADMAHTFLYQPGSREEEGAAAVEE